MSKKIAARADKIVLDVKVGNGAFMKTFEDAVKLASAMVRIGNLLAAKQWLSSQVWMSRWGRLSVIAWKWKKQLIFCQVGAVIVTLGLPHLRWAICWRLPGLRPLLPTGINRLGELLRGGQGLAKLADLITAQDGDAAVIERRELLPKARFVHVVKSNVAGYVQQVDTARIGYSAMILGAGREFKGQEIDLAPVFL